MSGLEILLILFYTVAFSVVILKTKLFESTNISKSFLVKVFIVKILVAYLYAYIHFENGWNDTFVLFIEGKGIAKLFLDDPELYFQFIFGTVEEPFSQEVLDAVGLEKIKKYRTTRSNFFVRINAVLTPFCYGFYSVLCIFYQFLSLLGVFYIYDFLVRKFRKNQILKLFIFFSPSILFWLSGLHKDGLTVFGLGLIIFVIDKLMQKKWRYGLILPFALIFAYLARDYALFIFIPPFIAYLIATSTTKRFYLPFLILYTVSVIFFFGGKYIHPSLDFPGKFIHYQNGFVNLEGDSNFEIVQLEPTIESFAESVPIAIFNILSKPNLTGIHSFWSGLAAVENIFYVVCAFFCIVFLNIKRYGSDQKSILLFFLLFGLSYFLILGLIVDNIGAIVRYKTTPLIFIGSALILLFDYQRFETFFGIKNQKLKKLFGQ